MKKAIAIIVSVLCVFAIASISFATEEKKAAPAPAAAEKKAPAKVKQVTGEVTMVDAKAKTITVKGKKGDVVVAADDKMMADVKAGDKVTVKYTEADGKNTAKSVKKAAAKMEEKKTMEPAAKPAEKK
jgi:ribosomal protein S1